MGVVYKAEDTKLKRTVALKFLPHDLTRDQEAKKRFTHEAQAASALDHPNIGTIYEVDQTEDGQMFIAMAYYEGETLKAKIERGPQPIDEAVEITLQIAQGLAKAHGKEIVHRDIKPANIITTADKMIKIIDFGLAKLAGRTKLTKDDSTLGTVAYMSPEQAQGTEVDHRTDIWALGAVLYEMVTGQQPFTGDYEQAVIYSIMNEEATPLTDLRSGVPMELERIANKSMAKNPDERYQHADEFVVDMRHMKEQLRSGKAPATATKAVPTTKGRKAAMLWAGAILGAGIVAIAAYLFFGKEAKSEERIPIAVVDFVNETDEEELNGLSGMLITALEQSQRLSVMTRSGMFDILRKLGRRDVVQIDESLGKEIALHAGLHVLAIASIRRFDDLYLIDLKLIDPIKDIYLFAANVTGEGKGRIPAMLDELAKEVRRGLKEKEEKILSLSPKVAEVTTPYLEAYRHYFKGDELFNKMRMKEAQAEFKKAIALDSTFGLAYYRLAVAAAWNFEEVERTALKKAMALLDRIPEKESYLVRAHNARLEKDFTAGIRILKKMEEVFPNDKEMLFTIGDWAVHSAQDSLAKVYFERVLALDPYFERALNHLIMAYQLSGEFDVTLEIAQKYMSINPKECLNIIGQYHENKAQYDSAVVYLEKALEIDSTYWDPLFALSRIYHHSGQPKKQLDAAKRYARFVGGPQSVIFLARAQIELGDFEAALETLELGLSKHKTWLPQISLDMASVHLLQGRFDKSNEILQSLIEAKESIAQKNGYLGLWMLNLYLGKYRQARASIEKVVALELQRKNVGRVVQRELQKDILLASIKDSSRTGSNRADKITEFRERIARTPPYWKSKLQPWLAYLAMLEGKDELAFSLAKRTHQPWIRSVIYSARQLCAEADSIRIIAEKASPFFGRIALLFHLAQCRYDAGQLEDAARSLHDLQGIFDASKSPYRPMYYPKSYYLLGKIYEQRGELGLAVKYYEKLLKLWKNADADLPELIDANARLAKLKGGSKK